jgi:hypothetical protein
MTLGAVFICGLIPGLAARPGGRKVLFPSFLCSMSCLHCPTGSPGAVTSRVMPCLLLSLAAAGMLPPSASRKATGVEG